MNTAIEIERKYIIRKPSLEVLSKQEEYSHSDIEQIYLPTSTGETDRVRRREYTDGARYYRTRKLRIDGMSAVETEGEITPEEYSRLAANPEKGTHPIHKTRHTFLYLGQLFEIDVYPEWQKSCILETELSSREVQVEFPPFIEVIAEVTGVKEYSNHSMSRAFPEEICK